MAIGKKLLKLIGYATPADAAALLAKEVGQRLIERLDPILLQPKAILVTNQTYSFSQQLKKRYAKPKIIQRPEQHLPTQSLDLILANLMPYKREELPQVFAEFKRLLKPNGLLLFSMLGPDTLYELRQNLAIPDHPFVDMHDIGDILVQTQFIDPVMDMEKLLFTYSEPAKLIADLRSLTKQHLKIDLFDYQPFSNVTGKLAITFEIIYGHAWGSQPITNTSTETIISVESLREQIKNKKRS